jgi:hypothetical protein
MISNVRVIRLILVLALSFLGLDVAWAQETIIADRPGFGNSSFVLPLGVGQVEVGVEFFETGGIDQYDVGLVLLRIGLDPIELRAIFGSFAVRSDSDADDEGFKDVGFGLKASLFDHPEGAWSLSSLLSVNIPTGSAFITADETLTTLSLLADFSISNRMALSTNLGYLFDSGKSEDIVSLILTPGLTFPGRPKLGTYFGYAGFYASSGDLHFLEGGMTFLATRDVQLDLNAGFEIESEDYFIGGGISTRWGAHRKKS